MDDNTDNNVLTLIKQTLTGSSDADGSATDKQIIDWNKIVLNETALNLSGDLQVSTTGKVGDLELDAKSSLNAKTAKSTLGYNVKNAGILDLSQLGDTVGGKLTIDGNYAGGIGSKLVVRTTWKNPDEQKSDTLVIKGNERSSTAVEGQGGILGNVTLASANDFKNGQKQNPVIKVEGTSPSDEGVVINNVFTGTAQTEGALEAQLYLNKATKSYYWVLDGQHEPNKSPISVLIFHVGVPSLLQNQRVVNQLGFDQLSRLHERAGEQKADSVDGKMNTEIWGRLHYVNGVEQGKERFAYAAKRGLL